MRSLLANLRVGQLGHVRVVIGVIADLMSPLRNGLHHLRVLIHPQPHQEEGALSVVLVENVQELGRIVRAPAGIEVTAITGSSRSTLYTGRIRLVASTLVAALSGGIMA